MIPIFLFSFSLFKQIIFYLCDDDNFCSNHLHWPDRWKLLLELRLNPELETENNHDKFEALMIEWMSFQMPWKDFQIYAFFV